MSSPYKGGGGQAEGLSVGVNFSEPLVKGGCKRKFYKKKRIEVKKNDNELRGGKGSGLERSGMMNVLK